MTCELISKQCIRQGASFTLSFGVVGVEDLTDWTCYLQVRDKVTGELTSIDRAITRLNVANDRFLDMLTKTETDALTQGAAYIVAGELENTVTGECNEKLIEIDIEKQWVVRP